LHDRLERLDRVADHAALGAAMAELRDAFEVSHVTYHALRACGGQWGATTYAPDWVRGYLAQGLDRVDPVVAGCFAGFGPIDWRRLDWTPRPARRLLGEGIAAGLGNQGVSLPIRGPSGQFAIFTVNHDASDARWARMRGTLVQDMLLVAHYVNARALSLDGAAAGPTRRLSPREAEVLTQLAAGCSRAQAAERLAISEHTLRAYVESARNKLGAQNTVHAVAHAMARGLIAL
jgi:DNA-binding CsgD family transcriptional regulator